MDRDTIIDCLRMTMDLYVFDPSTGEEKDPDDLNNLDRATYDACKGALEILERLDTDTDTISRAKAIEALKSCYCGGEDSCGEPWIYESSAIDAIKQLPPAQPEIVRCKDCLMHGACRFERGLGLDGYCSQAERRTDG